MSKCNFVALCGFFPFFKVANKTFYISQISVTKCSLIILKMRLSLAAYQHCLNSDRDLGIRYWVPSVFIAACCPYVKYLYLKMCNSYVRDHNHNVTYC